MNEFKAQERTVYWNVDAEKRNKRRRLKRKLVGWLLVGLPLAIFSLLLYWTGAWMGVVIVLGGIGSVFVAAFCVVRGLELILGDLF